MRKLYSILAVSAVLLGAAGAARAEEELVANPAYAMWAKYKPGTSVSMKMANEMTGLPANAGPNAGKQEMTQTRTLDSVTDEKIVVSTQISGGMIPAGRGGQKMDIPAKIAKSKLDTYMAPPGAKVTNVKDGTDKLDVNGKTLDVKTKEMDIETSQGGAPQKGHVKIWLTEEVPGGIGKMTMQSDMTMGEMTIHNNMTMTLDKFELAK